MAVAFHHIRWDTSKRNLLEIHEFRLGITPCEQRGFGAIELAEVIWSQGKITASCDRKGSGNFDHRERDRHSGIS